MRSRLGMVYLGCLLAGLAVFACSSDDKKSDACGNKQTAAEPATVISGMEMHSIITSPPANKDCPTKMVVDYRYNDEVLAEQQRPENVALLFVVEDGEEPDTLSQPAPVEETRNDMKFWSVTVTHTASDRASNPVYYTVYAGSEIVELPEIWVGAEIEYVPHDEPVGIPQ
jgi:hypothetical protein